MKPIIENHGDVFGTGDWYLFFCGKCNAQIDMNKKPKRCENCGVKILWSDSKDTTDEIK